MPYYGRTDPAEYYAQGGQFDPFTGRLNGGNLVMQFINQLQAIKQQKQQQQWAEEDRELKKRLTEAQIRNYDEPNKAEPKPMSRVSPVQVKSLMGRLGYPEESIAEVDTMNEPALKDTWAKLQSDFAS